jgi:hemoglobin/transferrin/lactoferrin receptor protein
MGSHLAADAFRRRHLFVPIGLLCAGLSGTAHADEEAGHLLTEVVVSATRTEQDAHDVASTITTVSDEQIEREMASDIRDMLRYEAGTSVRAQPNRASGVFRSTGRGGNEGINVRGLEGNQVLLQSDGVRLPASYSSGPYLAGRGDYIDMEAYRRVEILRGPSSTQFGSDGLSGAVTFITKDPKDLLTLGKPLQGAVKLGYSSVDESWTTVPSVAYAGEVFEAMLLASLRQGHETDNMGDNGARNVNRTEPNPQDFRSDYWLGKLVFKPWAGHQFKLTVDNMDRRVDTTAYSFIGDPFAAADLSGVELEERIRRELYKLDYEYRNADHPLFQRLTASLYRQDSENDQWGIETKPSAGTSWGTYRTRDTRYAESTVGGNVQFESYFGERITHRLVYGVDASQADITSMKNGFNSAGAAFVPNKSFPDTEYTLLGAFVQDEIGIGRVSIIPGLRFDSFRIDPSADALYRVNNTQNPSSLKAQELSPKIGAIWKIDPMANLFVQYAHGFRAPTPTQLNGGVSNLTSANPYMSIGNPDLKPETSDSWEVGIRGRSNALRYSVAAFHGKYKDFISANALVESNPAPIPDVFQSINLGKVAIRGFELRGDWAFTDRWNVSAAFAKTHGESDDNGAKEPLDSIDPAKLVLGLGYDVNDRYGAQVMLTHAERKKRNPDRSLYYNPDGYTVVDLTAYWRIDRNFSLNAGVFNLLNQKYYQWADVRTLAPAYGQIEAFSQPGRNFAASMKYQF